ncbi:MAG: hypothetical protein HYW02_01775 [Deltaproteobacteria bacterium]|nr:hypothetical protein [Deltaproteobacteria bacterium]MBI2500206.1 hypothetical protein [Deltaproteobacteria bacterium]
MSGATGRIDQPVPNSTTSPNAPEIIHDEIVVRECTYDDFLKDIYFAAGKATLVVGLPLTALFYFGSRKLLPLEDRTALRFFGAFASLAGAGASSSSYAQKRNVLSEELSPVNAALVGGLFAVCLSVIASFTTNYRDVAGSLGIAAGAVGAVSGWVAAHLTEFLYQGRPPSSC